MTILNDVKHLLNLDENKKDHRIIQKIEQDDSVNLEISIALKNLFHTIDQVLEYAEKRNVTKEQLDRVTNSFMKDIWRLFGVNRTIFSLFDLDNYRRSLPTYRNPPIILYERLNKLPINQKRFMLKFIGKLKTKWSGYFRRYKDSLNKSNLPDVKG